MTSSTAIVRFGVLRSIAIATLLTLTAASCHREAGAQASRDSLGPVRCFAILDDLEIASETALQLCAGAPSDAPGRCFARGTSELPEVSTQQLAQLCTAATSTEPITCYAHLDAEETLTIDQMIAYCATTCPLGPAPPQAADPDCLTLALDGTELSLQSAGELCAGASSAGPARCFAQGDDFELTDSQLVRLCAETSQAQCQYYNVQPQSY